MLIDSHTHLQFPQFDKDRDEVIKRTLGESVLIINAGADKKSSEDAVKIAEKYDYGVWATIGQHPTENIEPVFDYEFFKNLAKNPKIVAIGECGLEYYRLENDDYKSKETQKELFIRQIELAKEVNKPLVIHCRAKRDSNHAERDAADAFDDLINILSTHKSLLNSPPGIIHFFTGTINDAKKLLEMGFYFTFGGLITYNKSFDEIIKFLPIEKILLETDAPFVSPEPYRGKRNEPLYIIETAKKLAEIKNLSLEEISKITTENAAKVFGLKI